MQKHQMCYFSSVVSTNYLFRLANNFTVHFQFIQLFISKDEGDEDVFIFMSIDKMRNDQSDSFPICFHYLIAYIQQFSRKDYLH